MTQVGALDDAWPCANCWKTHTEHKPKEIGDRRERGHHFTGPWCGVTGPYNRPDDKGTKYKPASVVDVLARALAQGLQENSASARPQ